MKDVILFIAAAIGILGTCRFSLGIYANHWHHTRVTSVKALRQWDCGQFHNIMYQPRPLAVVINDWLEGHHV